jgi:uncharacterized membrane protein YccC
VLQIVIVESLVRLSDVRREVSGWAETRKEIADALRLLRAHLHPRSRYFRFALRLAAALCIGEFTARQLGLPNGYWIGMTTVLLLRMDFYDTWRRSLARVGGTIASALLATLLVHWLRPGPDLLAVLVLIFAMLAFAFLRTRYGVYSAWITAYTVFLLVFGGLAELLVARHRVLGTTIGAALAVTAHIQFRFAQEPSPRDEGTTTEPVPLDLD